MKKKIKRNKENQFKRQKIQKKKIKRVKKLRQKITPLENNNQYQKSQIVNEQGTEQIFYSSTGNMVIAINERKGFNLCVQKKYGPGFQIKTKQQAQIKAKHLLTQLKNIMKKFTKNYNFLRDQETWRIYDYTLVHRSSCVNKRFFDQFRKVMVYMNKAFVRSLFLQGRFFASLIIFSHVKFENLQILTLKNMVVSIEPLTWINCPSLKSLFIEQTDITSIKTLDKTNWRSLSQLCIMQNKIQSCSLERIHIKKGSTLKIIKVFIPLPFYNRFVPFEDISIQDIRQLVRCQVQWSGLPPHFSYCRNRILQRNIIKKLNQISIMQLNGTMDEENQSESL